MACARALTEVYFNCLISETIENTTLIILEPLISILNGGADRATQFTACICLHDFVKAAIFNNNSELLQIIANKTYILFLVLVTLYYLQ